MIYPLKIHDLSEIDTQDIISKLLNSDIPKSNIDNMKVNYKNTFTTSLLN